MSSPVAPSETRLAVGAGVACYLIWGIVPLVFQAIGRLGVGSWEILAHRSLWGAPTALVFVLLARQGRQALRVFVRPRVLGWLCVSAALIGANWSLYIWAINSGRVLECSLGYYITPLMNMAAGALIFREKIDRFGLIAIALAAVGVTFQAVALGHLPVISLALAVTFGAYAIVRKRVDADAQTGLFIECLLLAIPSVMYVAWLQTQGGSHFVGLSTAAFWLLACGPITALPLMLFSWSARRIPLSLMGFLQFMGPTIAFAIGFSQGEAFTPLRAVSFVFIWGGAVAYAWGVWQRSRTVAT